MSTLKHKRRRRRLPLVSKHKAFLTYLSELKNPRKRKFLLQNADNSQIDAISEICLNLLKGKIPDPSKTLQRKLRPFQKYIRIIGTKNVPVKTRKRCMIQHGGFLNLLIPAVAGLAGMLFGGTRR